MKPTRVWKYGKFHKNSLLLYSPVLQTRLRGKEANWNLIWCMFAKGFFLLLLRKKNHNQTNISIGFNINIKSRPTDDVGKAYTNACSEEIFGVHKKNDVQTVSYINYLLSPNTLPLRIFEEYLWRNESLDVSKSEHFSRYFPWVQTFRQPNKMDFYDYKYSG